MSKSDPYKDQDFSALCGWEDLPVEVSNYVESLPENEGQLVYSTAPDLKGFWDHQKSLGVTAILWFSVETEFFGSPQPPNFQKTGSCVSEGTDRAIQLANCANWKNTGLLTLPVDIANEPLYVGSRWVIGRGQLGNRPGSVGAWCAEYALKHGVAPRARYGNLDLTKKNYEWELGRGPIPPELIKEQKKHLVRAMNVRTSDELLDCLAAGHTVARCHSTLYGTRNSNGMSSYMKPGNHCQCMGGVFVLPDGDDGILEHQSWGPNNPGGPTTLKVKKGYGTPGAEKGEIQIPNNTYGIRLSDWEKARRPGSSDTWAFQVDKDSCFPPDKLWKILKKYK